MKIRKAELSGLAGIVAAACSAAPGDDAPRTISVGPFELAAGSEVTTCVSATLHNDRPLFVNSIELSTAPGVHHSNWFWVPEYVFDGPDGLWDCQDRGYNEGAAGVLGGVLFAQSTQATHETQGFPPGAVIAIPPRSRIVSGVHLLNPSDEPASVPLSITIDPIPEADVTTVLAGLAFENTSLALPPRKTSKFVAECDLGPQHRAVLSRPVDFKIYYALPHYHELGTSLRFEALRDSDGGAEVIWETAGRIGDKLGGPLAPLFDMTGRSKFRFTCTFDNPRDSVVRTGIGDQEMCIIVAYTDSPMTWGGGIRDATDPGPGVDQDGVMTYSSSACQVLSVEANR